MNKTAVTPFIAREGAPYRTPDEASRLFVDDVEALAIQAGPETLAEATEMVSDLDVSPRGFGRLSAYEAHVEDVVEDATDLLEELGFWVEWDADDAGYRIYRDLEGKKP